MRKTVRQKHNTTHYCRVCSVILCDSNWPSYCKNGSRYICTPCRNIREKEDYSKDVNCAQRSKERYIKIKKELFNYYNDKCNLCGLDNHTMLTIDHVNNDGFKHRKNQSNMYKWLLDNVGIDGYQLLCFNCNCSKNIEYKDKYNLINKTKVINYYGNFCAVCKENRIERLTIDHANNDGAEQRRNLKYVTGAAFYRWLIKNNYPDNLGLQVLCYNCNCSKRII